MLTGQGLNREDVYREFVVADGTDPADRRYDPAKPFSASIKKLIDLRYNANLTDALASFLMTPGDSPRRRALQEWREDRPGSGTVGADQLVHVISSLRFDQVSEVVGALAAFDRLSLGGIIELRSTAAWQRYHAILRDFLGQSTLDVFGDEEHGAEAVAIAYRDVIKQAGSITAARERERLERRWDPIVEIMIEFAGAVVSVFYNPAGDGGAAFQVVRDLLPGTVTRSAKAALHLVLGRVTRSAAAAQVDNQLRVLETRLDYGRRDWQAFVRGLEAQGLRRLDRAPGGSHESSAMEKNPQE